MPCITQAPLIIWIVNSLPPTHSHSYLKMCKWPAGIMMLPFSTITSFPHLHTWDDEMLNAREFLFHSFMMHGILWFTAPGQEQKGSRKSVRQSRTSIWQVSRESLLLDYEYESYSIQNVMQTVAQVIAGNTCPSLLPSYETDFMPSSGSSSFCCKVGA